MTCETLRSLRRPSWSICGVLRCICECVVARVSLPRSVSPVAPLAPAPAISPLGVGDANETGCRAEQSRGGGGGWNTTHGIQAQHQLASVPLTAPLSPHQIRRAHPLPSAAVPLHRSCILLASVCPDCDSIWTTADRRARATTSPTERRDPSSFCRSALAMGACFSNKTHPAGSVSTTLQRDTDKRIEDTLRAEQDEEKKVIKCLLLGKKRTRTRTRTRRHSRQRNAAAGSNEWLVSRPRHRETQVLVDFGRKPCGRRCNALRNAVCTPWDKQLPVSADAMHPAKRWLQLDGHAPDSDPMRCTLHRCGALFHAGHSRIDDLCLC